MPAGHLRYDVKSRDQNSDSRVTYLEMFSELDAVKAYKRRSFDLLLLEPGQAVVEAGCGTGADAIDAARRVEPGGFAVAVDADPVMVRVAARAAAAAGAAVRAVESDANRLPLADGSCHACRADRVLQHVSHPEATVKELLRLLRPGGRLALCDADWGTLAVSASDQPTTRAILNWFCDSIPQGWAGRRLGAWLLAAGAQLETVEGFTLCFRSLAEVDRALGLQQAALGAAEADAVSLEAAADWLSELHQQERAGRFLASITGFAAVGVKRG